MELEYQDLSRVLCTFQKDNDLLRKFIRMNFKQ